jgi:uncharacterized protein YjeT (DUF2065 family)
VRELEYGFGWGKQHARASVAARGQFVYCRSRSTYWNYPMPIEIIIARWVAVVWLVCGLSHLLYPSKWVALLLPLRDSETGGFVLAAMSLPPGLIIILGHNIWVWDLPVIVTAAGWATSIKGAMYLLFPRAHSRVMSTGQRLAGERMERAMRIMGAVMMILGAITAYDSLWRR